MKRISRAKEAPNRLSQTGCQGVCGVVGFLKGAARRGNDADYGSTTAIPTLCAVVPLLAAYADL